LKGRSVWKRHLYGQGCQAGQYPVINVLQLCDQCNPSCQRRDQRSQRGDIATDGRIGGFLAPAVQCCLDIYTDLFAWVCLKMNGTKTEAMRLLTLVKLTQICRGAYQRKSWRGQAQSTSPEVKRLDSVPSARHPCRSDALHDTSGTSTRRLKQPGSTQRKLVPPYS
jgi:hypothetical protein